MKDLDGNRLDDEVEVNENNYAEIRDKYNKLPIDKEDAYSYIILKLYKDFCTVREVAQFLHEEFGVKVQYAKDLIREAKRYYFKWIDSMRLDIYQESLHNLEYIIQKCIQNNDYMTAIQGIKELRQQAEWSRKENTNDDRYSRNGIEQPLFPEIDVTPTDELNQEVLRQNKYVLIEKAKKQDKNKNV